LLGREHRRFNSKCLAASLCDGWRRTRANLLLLWSLRPRAWECARSPGPHQQQRTYDVRTM
jgi:hypothetical protein